MREIGHLKIRWTALADWGALALFAATLLALGLWGNDAGPHGAGFLFHPYLRLPLLYVSTFVLTYGALEGGGLLSKWFSWDWLRWFGNISYSYYLLHGLILHFLLKFLVLLKLPSQLSVPAIVALLLFSFAVTAAGSSLLFLAIEKPLSLQHASQAAARARRAR
ncbi:MAG TPA: acyltransferase family protein [Candidatus Sulfopaludibacter sp.]|nr:acyltransferase family protein [Candidatus Sulfopaludibacter sp.]